MAQRGQATVEWAGILLLVLAVLAGGGALAARAGAPWLPRALKCALLGRCAGAEAELGAAYGDEVAALVRRYAPGLVYERGTLTLPVDFRRCRSHACSDGPDRAAADVYRSARGQQATVFTHVVDRRPAGGDLYIQYWLYYPDSTYSGALHRVARAGGGILARTPVGYLLSAAAGRHEDDWEGYQVRIAADGRVLARASAHHGYTGRRVGPDRNINQLPGPAAVKRLVPAADRAAWIEVTGWTRVSRGSHAGHLVDGPGGERRTEADGLDIVPLERLTQAERAARFPSIAPPWRKRVYDDPESPET